MKEISLHIMDVVQNSITANATLIEVALEIQNNQDKISVVVKDNGKGMNEEILKSVENPFTTTRTTRKVGLGVPLFKAGAENSGGTFTIASCEGVGTELKAVYTLSHIDRPPIGDFAGTMQTLIISNPNIDFVVEVGIDTHKEVLDTREVKKVLGEGISLNTPEVALWLKANLKELFPSEYQNL